MIRSRNPRLDVAVLKTQLADELQADPQLASSERLVRLAATVHMRTIETTLEGADERSAARTEWPAELAAPPMFASRRLRRFVLRMLGLILRDQHEVNAQLIRAHRESLSLMRDLVDRIEDLESRLDSERVTARAERLARRNIVGRSGDGAG